VQIMLEELERRNYASATIPLLHPHRRALRPTFPSFSGSAQPGAYPSVSGSDVPRVEVGPNTVTQRLAALRFFYVQVLKRAGALPRRRIRRRFCIYHRC